MFDNTIRPVDRAATKEATDIPIRALSEDEMQQMRQAAVKRSEKAKAEPAVREVKVQPPPEPPKRQPDVKAEKKPVKPTKHEPDAVALRHNLFVEDKMLSRRYYADYQQTSEVMRATEGKISTQRSDRETVTAMLGLAQDRGWKAIKAGGDQDFKREMWVTGRAMGIEVVGYKPTPTDQQELERRKKEITPVKPSHAEPGADQGGGAVKITPQPPVLTQEAKPAQTAKQAELKKEVDIWQDGYKRGLQAQPQQTQEEKRVPVMTQ